MKQILIKAGKPLSKNIPDIDLEKGCVQIRVRKSCISIGTELRDISNSGKSFLSKAVEKPEKVKQLGKMLKEYGIDFVLNKIAQKKGEYSPTGYSISGEVISTGEGVENFNVGDFVAGAGAKNAFHAGIVNVPSNLCVKFDSSLSFSHASTVAIGSIALHSIRRSNLQIGEFCVVYGTGVLGLLAIQLLKSSGVRVAAIDINATKLELAKKFGAELIINASKNKIVEKINQWTGGYGSDAAILAVASSSSVPISNCFKLLKRKGKVVILGAAGMDINREDIYHKELDIITSTSYGPGRYDKKFEQEGLEYPYGYVRWTENRNMSEYLRLLQKKSIKVSNLISKEFDVENSLSAFEYISNPENNSLLVIIDHMKKEKEKLDVKYPIRFNEKTKSGKIRLGIIGISPFFIDVHLPNIIKLKKYFKISGVYNRTSYKTEYFHEKLNAFSTSQVDRIINNGDIDCLIIANSHGEHAEIIIKCINAKKHVFVEKPLATTLEELESIKNAFSTNPNSLLMVGYNRRYSPIAKEIKTRLKSRINPIILHYRMNAGYKSVDDKAHEYGGRIIGECCHIIDLCTYFINSQIKHIHAEKISPKNGHYFSSDNIVITMKYDDGSIANIQYFANGSESLAKEYMEIHVDGNSIQMNDYKSLKINGELLSSFSSDRSIKGHIEELNVLYEAIIRGERPTPVEQLFETTLASIQLSKI